MKKYIVITSLFLLVSLFFATATSAEEESDNSTVDIQKATKYYITLDGEQIEYKESNLDLIREKKEEDLKRYNKTTGENLTMNDLGNNNPVTINEVPYSLVKRIPYTIQGNLPDDEFVMNGKMVSDGDLFLVQQVFYLGKVGDNLRYRYHSVVEWADAPFSQKVDAFASAWDEKAVAVDNTFSSSWLAEKVVVGGWISDSGTIKPDPDAFEAYGHGIKKEVEYGDYYHIVMDREVAVNEDYIGHRANIITKYHHTYATIAGVGISIGPASIDISGSWGDTIVVEYGFDYGDS